MHPVFAENTGAFDGIVGFLALADGSVVTGDNLIAVWYTRTGEGWDSKSWGVDDPCKAIKAVKLEMGIADSEDERWEICSPAPEPAAAPGGQAYASGVLANDPVADLVGTSPDRNALIEYLTSIGYAAADIAVDKEEDCTKDVRLEYLAIEAARMIQDGDETVLTLGSLLCAAAAVYPTAPPWGPPNVVKPPVPATVPGWSPAGTTPTAPAWTPNTWSLWVCTSTLVQSSTKCQCRKSRRWGRWECRPRRFGQCRTTWHEIWECEKCETQVENPAPAGWCPAGGPPPGGVECDSSFFDQRACP